MEGYSGTPSAVNCRRDGMSFLIMECKGRSLFGKRVGLRISTRERPQAITLTFPGILGIASLSVAA